MELTWGTQLAMLFNSGSQLAMSFNNWLAATVLGIFSKSRGALELTWGSQLAMSFNN